MMKINIPYYLYRIYAEMASRYYAYRDRNKPIPLMVCQICGKPGHVERLCPNAARMGFINRDEKQE
jgi:hypothetical protein